MRWALGRRMFGPYFELVRDLATFALGAVSTAGRPLLREAATRPTPRRLVPFTQGPGAASAAMARPVQQRPEPCPLSRWALGRRMLGAVSMAGRPLLRKAATPRRLVPLSRGAELCRGPATCALGR